MIPRLRNYLFASDSVDQNSDDCKFDQNSDDPKSVSENKETGKIISYSTDQLRYDQNSDAFDFDMNSDDPKNLREDEETKKILGCDSGGLFQMEDGVIKSFNFPLPSHPMTTYSESEAKNVFEVCSTWESRDLLVAAAKLVGKINGFSITIDSNKVICNRGGTERRRDGNVSKRNLVGGSIMTGCTWGIKLKAMSVIHISGKRSRPNYKVGNVRIIAFCGRH